MSQSDLSRLLLEAIRYEHWLRFHFLDDPESENEAIGADADGLAARLRVPEEVVEASRRAEPHLYPLLEALRDRPITLEGSRDAVFRYVNAALGGESDEAAFGERLFALVADPDFRRGLDAFHGWVQELANGEISADSSEDGSAGESDAPSFAIWQAEFERWAGREAVRHVSTISPFGVKTTLGSAEDDAADGH